MRRSLSNVGGRIRPWGDASLSKELVRCFRVDSDAKLRFTHGFHAYPGRMHPQIAERLIEWQKPRKILDPFVGSGTVAVEAVRAGLPSIGADISRVALEIAWVRTRVWKPEECRKIEAAGNRIWKIAITAMDEMIPTPPWAVTLTDWFDPRTIGEIGIVKTLVEEETDAEIRRALTVVLSSLMVKLSRQVSDSVTVVEESSRPWPPRAVFKLFRDKCADLTKGLLLLSSDLHKRKVAYVEPEFRRVDARTLEVRDVDLVITSPPYASTYDYGAHHAVRFPLYGEEGAEGEIGSRKEQARGYREDMKACLKRMLAAAPKIVMLIGDGYLQGARVEANRMIGVLAQELRARVRAGASREGLEWSHARRGERRQEHLILVTRS